MATADPELELMQDRQKDQGEELIEVNLVEERRSAQPTFFSTSLFLEHRTTLLELLKEYKDVFS